MHKNPKENVTDLTISPDIIFHIIRDSLDAILIVDSKHHVLYMNACANALNTPLTALIKLIDLEEKTAQEISISQADSTRLILRVFCFCVEWNNQLSHMICLRDIMEQKNKEKALAYLAEHKVTLDLSHRVHVEKKLRKQYNMPTNSKII
jgi:hypothetical protein